MRRDIIRNGRAYPLTQRNAVIAEWDTTTKSAAVLSNEYNVSAQTVKRWAGLAGLQRPVHPNVAAANATRAAKARAEKAFNTPVHNADGSITYQGRTYF